MCLGSMGKHRNWDIIITPATATATVTITTAT